MPFLRHFFFVTRLLGSIGTADDPAVRYEPRYLDTDDKYNMVVSQESNGIMLLTQLTYYDAPF